MKTKAVLSLRNACFTAGVKWHAANRVFTGTSVEVKQVG